MNGSQRLEGGALWAGAVCALLGAIVGGCKVGPNYRTPGAPVASNWIDYQNPRVKTEEQDLSRWWAVFRDPVLDSLMADAYRQNLSLRAAGARIAEARARRGIAVGNLFPQEQELAGSATANKFSDRGSQLAGEEWAHNVEAGFNVGWEIDFWGRFRRAIEAADAELEASMADFDDVLVVLLADVSANYVQYRTFQERVRVARHNVEIQEGSYQIANDKFKAGATTERDSSQAKQVLEQTRASIPDLEAGQRRAANALCVLLGIPITDLTARLGQQATIPAAEPELALGIPADLLRRRPDVRRIERQAAAQSAVIGIAQTDAYPHFSLLGSIGVQGGDFNELFDTPGSLAGSIGPGFQWDILHYGRIRNNVRAQEARFQQLVAAYQEEVLRAGREAEDAVIGFLKSQERVRALELSVAAAQRTVDITNDQYKQGVVDFTAVYVFEGTLAEQQDQLAIARGEIALNLVELYRSLGGGWENQPANPPPTTQP